MSIQNRFKDHFKLSKPKKYKTESWFVSDQSRIGRKYKNEGSWFWPVVIAGTVVVGFGIYGIFRSR